MKSLLVSVSLFAVCACLLEDEPCPRKHHALVVALLPLHKGSSCTEIVQKGIQQKVALETALEGINTGDQLPIALKILDTCSSKDNAVESALKGIAFAEKRCSRYPIFLGFLGPDDEESMTSLMDIVNYTHVVPVAVKNFHQFNAINVEMIDTEDRAKRLISFLRYLNWYSFILLFTSDSVSTNIAAYIIESDQFCLTNAILRLPSFASDKKDRRTINRLRRTIEEVENVRVVIITDDDDIMSYFTDYVEEGWGEMEYVIYTLKSGILPWRLPVKTFRNSIILHEAPKSLPILSDFEETLKNSTMWTNYLSQIGLNDPPSKLEIDSTIVPYIYSLHLYSRALKATTRRKCGLLFLCAALKNLTQTEWKSTLQDTITFLDNEKIRFFRNLDYNLDIIVYDEEDSFDIVGTYTNDLRIYNPEKLRRSNRSRTKQCYIDLYEYELEPDRDPVIFTKEEQSEAPVVKERMIQLNFGYNELLATVIGFPIGIILIITLSIVCVCKSFKNDARKDNLSED